MSRCSESVSPVRIRASTSAQLRANSSAPTLAEDDLRVCAMLATRAAVGASAWASSCPSMRVSEVSNAASTRLTTPWRPSGSSSLKRASAKGSRRGPSLSGPGSGAWTVMGRGAASKGSGDDHLASRSVPADARTGAHESLATPAWVSAQAAHRRFPYCRSARRRPWSTLLSFDSCTHFRLQSPELERLRVAGSVQFRPCPFSVRPASASRVRRVWPS